MYTKAHKINENYTTSAGRAQTSADDGSATWWNITDSIWQFYYGSSMHIIRIWKNERGFADYESDW